FLHFMASPSCCVFSVVHHLHRGSVVQLHGAFARGPLLRRPHGGGGGRPGLGGRLGGVPGGGARGPGLHAQAGGGGVGRAEGSSDVCSSDLSCTSWHLPLVVCFQ